MQVRTSYSVGWYIGRTYVMLQDAMPGDAECLVDIQRDNIDTYYELTEEQKKNLLKALEEEHDTQKFGTRLTQRNCANKLHHCMQQMQDMVCNVLLVSRSCVLNL